jgi:hypothetical protein
MQLCGATVSANDLSSDQEDPGATEGAVARDSKAYEGPTSQSSLQVHPIADDAGKESEASSAVVFAPDGSALVAKSIMETDDTVEGHVEINALAPTQSIVTASGDRVGSCINLPKGKSWNTIDRNPYHAYSRLVSKLQRSR